MQILLSEVFLMTFKIKREK